MSGDAKTDLEWIYAGIVMVQDCQNEQSGVSENKLSMMQKRCANTEKAWMCHKVTKGNHKRHKTRSVLNERR
jgi:hypothetical protein